ncbi:MAG: DUF975 family protein [Bacilli bacterium]|nr:DUF975 family protein [Bacilli bacterium]
MKRAREYRKESRELLGHELFGAKWMWALLVLLIVSATVSAAAGVTCGIAALVVAGPLEYGCIRVYLRLVRHEDEHAEIMHLWAGFKGKIGQTFVVELLQYIYIFLWTLLLIIPGIIKSYAYAATMYLVHEQDLSGNEAITASRKLMKGRKWKLFCLDLSFIGWYIVGFLCLGVGVLWVQTYHTMAKTLFFEDAMKEGEKCCCGHCHHEEEKVEVVDAK